MRPSVSKTKSYYRANEISTIKKQDDKSSQKEANQLMKSEKTDASSGKKKVNEKYELMIQNLQMDRSNLLKKCNIAEGDFMKIKNELADIENQIKSQKALGDGLEKEIFKSQNVAQVLTKNLQEDLNYERELNLKLQEECSNLEEKKSKIETQIQNQKMDQEYIESEIDEMKNALAQSEAQVFSNSEDLTTLQASFQSSEDEIRKVKAKTNQENKESDLVRQDIIRVEGERSDLLERMNEYSQKYELYVNNVKDDRQNLTKKLNRDKRLLTSQLMVSLIARKIITNICFFYDKIRQNLLLSKLKEKSLFKLISNISRFKNFILYNFFLKYKYVTLNWPDEIKRKNMILQNMVIDRQKQVFYTEWYNSYILSKNISEEKLKGLSSLIKISHNVLRRTGFICLASLNEYFRKKEKELNALQSISNSLRLWILRKTINKWGKNIFEQKLQVGLHLIHKTLTEAKAKQLGFNMLKLTLRNEKFAKIKLKYEYLKNWKRAFQKNNLKIRSIQIASNIEENNSRYIKSSILDHLLHNCISEKLQKNNIELEERKTTKEKLILDIGNANLIYEDNKMRNSIKTLIKNGLTRIYSYFRVWRVHQLNYRRKCLGSFILLEFNFKKKYRNVINKWRTILLQNSNQAEAFKNANSLKELKKVTNDSIVKQRELTSNSNYIKRKQSKKLIKLIRLIESEQGRKRILHWANIALRALNIESALKLFGKSYRINLLRNAFNFYTSQVRDQRLQEGQEKVVLHLLHKHRFSLLEKLIIEWKKYVSSFKKAKHSLSKTLNNLDKKLLLSSINKWVNFIKRKEKSEKRGIYNSLNENLGKSKDIVSQLGSIVLSCSNKIAEGENSKKRAAFLAFFFTKRKGDALDLQTYINRWKDNSSIMRRRKVLLRKYLQIKSNEEICRFFNKWLEFLFQFRLKQRIVQITESKRSQEYNSKQLEIVLSEADEKVGKLGQDYEALSNEAEVLNIKMTKAAEFLGKKKSRNTYSSLLSSSFFGWKSVIEKEKETMQKLFDSTKQYVLSDVFIKMKNKSLENKEIERKRKSLDLLFKIKTRILNRYCFHKWEEFVTTEIYGGNKNNVREINDNQVQLLKEIDQSNERVFKDSLRLYSKKFKLLIFKSFINICRKLKNLRLHSIETTKRINLIRMKQSFAFLRKQSNKQRFLSAVENKIKQKYQSLLLARSFNILSQNKHKNKILQNAVKNFSERKILEYKKYFLNKALLMKSQSHKEVQFSKKLGLELFESIGIIFDKKKLIAALQKWRSNCTYKKNHERSFGRILHNLINVPQRKALNSWKQISNSHKLKNDINVFGKRSLECFHSNNQIESLNKFIDKEGLNSNEINQNLSKSLSKNDSILKRMLSRWILYGTEDFNVKRALKLWNDFAFLRDRLRKAITRLENLINKPSLEFLFRKWAKLSLKEREELKLLNKSELIEKCTRNYKLKLDSDNLLQESVQFAERNEAQAKLLREKNLQSLLLALMNSKKIYKFTLNKGYII